MMSVHVISTDGSRSIQKGGANAFETLWHQRQSKAKIWALAVATLVFGLAYFQTFRTLIATWYEDPNYSHGFLVIPIAVLILRKSLARGYALRLVSSLNDASGLPTVGKNLIIVAAVNNVLHFRIFNGDGTMVVNTDEKRLPKQDWQIEDFKKQLESLWPPYKLTWSEKDRVVAAVTSIVGYTITDAEQDSSPRAALAPWWGWVFLVAVLVVRDIAYGWNSQGLENITLLLAIACLTWTFGGWSLLRRSWLAIAYLIFMLPLPPTINNMVALPLQRIATTGSCFLLQLSGLWAIQEGNVINLNTPHGMVPLDVALACNGLRMLMTMVATVIAFVILVDLSTWKRIVLLLSAVPIALLSNIMRIAITGWCYYLIRGPNFKEWAHDVSGWLMMPLALALVGLELGILSWLVPPPDKDTADDEKPMLPMAFAAVRGSNREEELLPGQR
jgi:exosortase